MKKTKINVALLRKVQRAIKNEPKQFNMDNWFLVDRHKMREDLGITYCDFTDTPIPKCGTAACIAGWAYSINLEKNPAAALRFAQQRMDSVAGEAAEVLGLTDEQADRLFYAGDWPEPFDEAYDSAKTPEAAAAVAIRRINHFIKTRGEE